MNWKQRWIDQVLAEIPGGRYRRRMETELCDHLETYCSALMEAGKTESEARAETLRMMGEPDKLREEYSEAWRQILPGRLAVLAHQLKSWAGGCAVMLGVQTLASYMQVFIERVAPSLPRDSQEPWVRLIQGASKYLQSSSRWVFLPLVFALMAGAFFLGRRFRASRRPGWQLSVGLSLHWSFIASLDIWLEALDDHITFWEELKHLSIYDTKYYSLSLVLCVLLGVVFGHMSAREKPSAA